MRSCGYQGGPVGAGSANESLPAWLPDQLKIDNQRKCRLVKLTPHLRFA